MPPIRTPSRRTATRAARLRHFGGLGFGRGGFGFGEVTITAINGSNLSLKTEDGWTRTIAVTADTTITRAGKTIAVADLKVGDQIAFRQDRQTDGTYTITAINVVLPSIGGTVTKIDGSTITVERRDGTTETIHVDADTTYRIAGDDTPALSDIKVGDIIIASGTLRDDGSLDAEAVGAGGPGRGEWFGGHGPRRPTRSRTPRRHPPPRRADRLLARTFRRGGPIGSSRRTDSHVVLSRRGFHGQWSAHDHSRTTGDPAMFEPTAAPTHPAPPTPDPDRRPGLDRRSR